MLKCVFLLVSALLCVSTARSQGTATAYNTFLETPQRSGQEPGFGYYGGMQVTSTIFGVSFIPTISGPISDVWIAVGTSLADVGTDLFDVIIATSGSEMEPAVGIAAVTIQGELSKGESVVRIPAGESDIFIQQGSFYWMLIAPGVGTPQVGWLGGPPNEPPGTYSAYPDSTKPTGWFIAPTNSNGAMRIDVALVPEPSALWLMFPGLLLLVLVVRRQVRS